MVGRAQLSSRGLSRAFRTGLLLLALSTLAGCAALMPRIGERPQSETGVASYYDPGLDGRRTASGAHYHSDALTAAHRTLPFGTRVRVTNVANGRSVEVTINDRGPHRRGRIIDLSRRAAGRLGFLRQGTARVRVEVLEP